MNSELRELITVILGSYDANNISSIEEKIIKILLQILYLHWIKHCFRFYCEWNRECI